MAGSNYEGPYATGDTSFGPDRGWGTCFIVLYTLLIFALFVLLALGLIGSVIGDPEPGTQSHIDLTMPTAEAFLAVLNATQIACAIGIRKSRAWGFRATVVLSIVSLAGSLGGTCLTIIPLIYSILRLTAVYGPKPS